MIRVKISKSMEKWRRVKIKFGRRFESSVGIFFFFWAGGGGRGVRECRQTKCIMR